MSDPYFEINRVSNSSLGWFLKSPAYYKMRMDTDFQEVTPALTFGSVVHCLVLEPENFDRDFWTMNIEARPEISKGMTSKLNKAWKQQKEMEHSSQSLIAEEDLRHAEKVARSLEKEAGSLIRAGGNVFEKSLMWEKDGVKMKAKVDISNDMFLADLKTSVTSDPWKWQRKAYYDFNYHRQAAVYLDGDAGGIYTGEKEFYFIVVEKSAPYLVSVHHVSPTKIGQGMTQYNELIKRLKWCQKNDKWPHYELDVYEWE